MIWENCGYFEFRLVDHSGKIVGRVERDYKQEWHARGIGVYTSELQAKQAVERQCAAGEQQGEKK